MLLQTKAVLRVCFGLCNFCLLFRGRTALHGSSFVGHLEVCKLLVELQADVNVEDDMCDARPLHLLFKTKAVFWVRFERCKFCLFSVERLHCINLLDAVTWRFASSWSSCRLTSM
jgi:hypothetical protein